MVLEKCFTDEFISSRAGNNIDKKKIYSLAVENVAYLSLKNIHQYLH